MKRFLHYFSILLSSFILFNLPIIADEYDLTPTGTFNGYGYVDLGLPSGNLWATCNIGAMVPEEQGDYIAWAEIAKKDDYSWATYAFCLVHNSNKSCSKYEKYYVLDEPAESGLTVIEPIDDVATMQWGGGFHVPTKEELEELIANTTPSWIEINGMTGMLLTSKENGNKMFIPHIGYRFGKHKNESITSGYYWSSTIYPDTLNAYSMHLSTSTAKIAKGQRREGRGVRPALSAITYHANSGEGEMNVVLVSRTQATQISNCRFVRTNHKFVGWNTKADGTGVSYAPNTSFQDGTSLRLYAQWEEVPYRYVDLGLPSGTLWATFNVGAVAPEEYGDYFAWGETETKEKYDWTTYKWSADGTSTMTKYNSSDKFKVLELSDDAAHVHWGDKWHTPTNAQQEELINAENCTWVKTTQNGVVGYLVKSTRNGNSIFLPAAGHKIGTSVSEVGSIINYWNNLVCGGYFPNANFLTSSYNPLRIHNVSRSLGFSVRPVVSVIKYHANGGVGEMPNTLVQPGEENQLSANAYTRKGYTFNGWNTKTDGSGDSYADQASVVLTGPLELYAQWVPTCTEYVDLGLPSGTLWATCNVGADQAEDYGDYFAWGEIAPKETYSQAAYQWYNGSSMTKYNATDGLNTLELADDAAQANWHGNWHMPTNADYSELINSKNCTKEAITQNGVAGYKITSNTNGQSIFLPKAGYYANATKNGEGTNVYTWSSTVHASRSISYYCTGGGTSMNHRYYGMSVRPIMSTITYHANGGEGEMDKTLILPGNSYQLSANAYTKDGYAFIGWNTKADGTGVSYSDYASVQTTSSIPLYAQWKEITLDVTIEAEYATITCINQLVTLTATVANATETTYTYQWSAPNETANTFQITEPGQYSVTVTDANTGQVGYATLTMTEEKTYPTVDVQPYLVGCLPEGIDLHTAIGPNTNADHVTFYGDEALTQLAANRVLLVPQQTTYYVQGANDDGCVSQGYPVEVNVLPELVVPTISIVIND